MKKILSSLISKTLVILMILTLTLSGCSESLFVPIIEEFDEANPPEVPEVPGISTDFTIRASNSSATVTGDDIYTNTTSFVITSSVELDGFVYYKFWTGGTEPDDSTIVPMNFKGITEKTISLALSGGANDYTVKVWYDNNSDDATVISGTIHYDTTPPSISLTSNDGSTVSSNTLDLKVSTGASDVNRIKLWNELQSVPGSYSNYSSPSQTNTLPASASEGSSYTVSAVLMDRAGNVSSTETIDVTYDPGLPSVGSFVIAGGASATNSNTVDLTYAASDSGTDVKVQFSNDGTSWSAAETASGTHSGWNITSGYGAAGGDGTKTVYIRAVDEADNYSPVASSSITYDTEAPQLSGLSVVQDGDNTDYTVALNYTVTDLTDILVEFSNSGTDWTTPASVSDGGHTYSDWDIIESAYGGTAGSGEKTAYIRVTDEAGNSDDAPLGSVTYNASGLVISGFNADEGSATDSASITVNYEMNDPGENVTVKLANELPGNWDAVAAADTLNTVSVGDPMSGSTTWNLTAGDGPKTVYIYAETETLGDSDSLAIELDTTSPDITAFSIAEAGPTNDNTVTLNYTLADMAGTALTMEFSNNGSDWSDPITVTSATGAISDWDLTDPATGGSSATGSRTVHLRVTDGVDQTDSMESTSSTFYDETNPVIGSFAISGDPATDSSTVGLTFGGIGDDSGNDVALAFSNDGTSWTTPSTALTSPYNWDFTASYGGNTGNGLKTIYIRATDEAGNSVTETDTVYFDTADPQGTLTVLDDYAYTKDGTVTLDYSAYGTGTEAEVRFSNNGSSWSAWEALSGSDIASVSRTRSWNIISGYGGNNSEAVAHTVYMEIRDQVDGHIITAELNGIIYDATAPAAPAVTVAESVPAPFVTGQNYIRDDARDLNITVDHSGDSDFYKIWDSGTTEPTVFQSVPSGTSFSPDYTIPASRADGTYNIIVKLFDMAENTASGSDAVRLDKTDPALSSLSIDYDDEDSSTVSDNVLDIDYSASDTFGLAGYKLWDSSVSEPVEFTRISVAPVPSTYSLPDVSGQYTLYLTFCDVAGNIAASPLQKVVNYDGDPPAINNMFVSDSSNTTIAFNINNNDIIQNGTTTDNDLLVDIAVNSNTPASTYKAWYTGESDQVKEDVTAIAITEDYYSLTLPSAGDYVIHTVAYDSIGNESNELTVSVTYAP